MLFIICGEIGAGKSAIGSRVASELKMEYFCTDEIKHQTYSAWPRYAEYQQGGGMMPFELRMKAAQKVIVLLRSMAEHGVKNVILDENMYKRDIRELYYQAGRDMFGGYKITLIQSSNTSVSARLNKSEDSNQHTLSKRWNKRIELQKEFDPMPEADRVIQNDTLFEDSLTMFRNFISDK